MNEKNTGRLHNTCFFYVKFFIYQKTIQENITKCKMKTIEKKVRGGNKSPYFATMQKIAESQ